jgi:hypothetical protein
MSTDAQDILRTARSLPLHEQLEVLQGLAQSLAQAFAPLADASAAFWSQRTIEDLLSERRTPVISDVQSLVMPVESSEPPDETADDLIAYIHAQRQAYHSR